MDIKEKTTEKIEGELKALKIITGALIGVLGLLFLVCIYGLLFTEDKGGTFGALIVVPIALGAILPVYLGNMKKMKAELELRK